MRDIDGGEDDHGYVPSAAESKSPAPAAAVSTTVPVAQAAGSKNERFREMRSEEHTSELQSQFRISYAVFCLKKKKKKKKKEKKKKKKRRKEEEKKKKMRLNRDTL